MLVDLLSMLVDLVSSTLPLGLKLLVYEAMLVDLVSSTLPLVPYGRYVGRPCQLHAATSL